MEHVKEERKAVHEGLRRLGRRYQDRLCDDAEYDRQKRLMEMEL